MIKAFRKIYKLAIHQSKIFVILTLILLAPSTSAQELDPRSYINIPIDQNFIGLAYAYTDGDIYTSPDVPIEDLTLRIDGQSLAYVRSFSLFGNSAKVDASIGHACTSGKAIFEGENVSRSFCGVTDTKVRLNYNFYGAPALTLKEYVKHKKTVVAGISMQINMPTGEYDTDFVFNIGSNRWYLKPEIGISIPHKKWEFDFSLGGKFFTENDEFKKTSTLKQDPIYNFQVHVIYDISRSQWISLNTNYFQGGETYLDGSQTSITRGNARTGITYSYAFNAYHSLKLLANTGVTTRLGNDSEAYAVAWAYRWE